MHGSQVSMAVFHQRKERNEYAQLLYQCLANSGKLEGPFLRAPPKGPLLMSAVREPVEVDDLEFLLSLPDPGESGMPDDIGEDNNIYRASYKVLYPSRPPNATKLFPQNTAQVTFCSHWN